MAKASRDKDQGGEALPGLTELLSGPKKEPRPRPKTGPAISDEDLLAPLPQPGEAPRPQAVKVRAKAGTGPKIEKGREAKKKSRRWAYWKEPGFVPNPDYIFDPIGELYWLLVLRDAAERMRFKLRWLGLTRYIFLPIIAIVVAALVITYLWYLFWDYNEYLMVFSRHVPTVYLLIPSGVGLAMAVFLPVNWLLLGRYEKRWNRTLRDMLREKIPTKVPTAGKPAGTGPEAAPTGPLAPEPPLPQPTVNPMSSSR